ncbi:LysM and putative peptidoglycan-binding domain-containing protein 3 [Pteropus alecto]|uniref:LysM and putative peptidoglycan-binding domain-containing protein 3 n=1 Tax=Pteropus alecto TaxID=9402 RepID=L5KJK3_PTEAL|nr:LysM and putative peptidoglycan-binding domain-containing protein 3 [Pteropus alecto]
MTHDRFADVAAAQGPEGADADRRGNSCRGGSGGGRGRGSQKRRLCHELTRNGRAGGPGSRLLVVSPLLTGQVKMAARDFDIMAGRHQNRSFPLPGVHSSGQVHAFGNCTESDVLEEDVEVYELRSRGKEKIRRSTSRDRLDDIIVLTKDIQEGDTLNAIALQYCCTVADIKRVNNLISDQDFFALSESAGSFLKEVDRDIEQLVKCTDTKRENLNEVVSALTAQQIRFEPDNKNIQPKVDVSHHSTVDSSHLHSGVTPTSQQREVENGIAPTQRIPFDQQGEHKLYSHDSQSPAAQHKT